MNFRSPSPTSRTGAPQTPVERSGNWERALGAMGSRVLPGLPFGERNMLYFPLLVLKLESISLVFFFFFLFF